MLHGFSTITEARRSARFDIDGVSQTTSGSYSSGITIADNASNVSWLGQSNTGSGSAFFSGRMQEFRIDSVARSADWVNLCYLTQKSLSIVSGGSIAGTPLTPVLTSPTNGAAGLPTSGLALSWSSPAGPPFLPTMYPLLPFQISPRRFTVGPGLPPPRKFCRHCRISRYITGR